MSRDVYVAGVGMIPFTKPGSSEPYPRMASRALSLALTDAGIGYQPVQQAYVGYVYGDSTGVRVSADSPAKLASTQPV